jgi:hypothetical protein
VAISGRSGACKADVRNRGTDMEILPSVLESGMSKTGCVPEQINLKLASS